MFKGNNNILCKFSTSFLITKYGLGNLMDYKERLFAALSVVKYYVGLELRIFLSYFD
jgi:hypothetical protein